MGAAVAATLLFAFLHFEAAMANQTMSHNCRRNQTQPATIVILSGQSNMAGRGGVRNGTWDGVVPPECTRNPSILRLSAGLHWEEAREPLHFDIDVNKTNGISPGMPFAHGVLRRIRGALGLVPCAIGGTGIDEWQKGRWLYENMLKRARAAAAGGGKISALLWYQGESDASTLEAATSYKGKMERMVLDFRSDLGLPDLLVIQVALASGQCPFTEQVRQSQKGVNLPKVTYVDAKGLELDDLHLHLTTSAQLILGMLLAVAYLEHIAPCHCE